ncbi:MAG: dihydrofolate reductase, partial [Clostridia bacterium]|nr:dihydrofolate reductase [Clostridia bacterium]
MRAIVNVNPRWGIGNENRLLVHIRSDMRRFRAMTSGNTIIIGRKTLDTFPDGKPLKNRENIILTR